MLKQPEVSLTKTRRQLSTRRLIHSTTWLTNLMFDVQPQYPTQRILPNALRTVSSPIEQHDHLPPFRSVSPISSARLTYRAVAAFFSGNRGTDRLAIGATFSFFFFPGVCMIIEKDFDRGHVPHSAPRLQSTRTAQLSPFVSDPVVRPTSTQILLITLEKTTSSSAGGFQEKQVADPPRAK